jgi:hypothetical protein
MKNYFILISIALTMASCEDVINVDLDNGTTLLVVDGMLTDDAKPQHVRLSTTAPYFQNEQTPRVSGAFVEIKEYDENGLLITIDTLVETTANSGDYFTQKINNGTIGHKYDLTVKALGETYISSSTMQRIPPIDSVVLRYETYNIPELTGYHAYYYGPETPGMGDNYLFRIYKNGKLYDAPNQIYFASDELVDGNYIGEVDVTPEIFELGDTVKVESYTTSRDQYYFFVEMSKQVNNGGIFANPPANIRTNIKNINSNGKKAVGYFSANATNSLTTIVK